jgi:Protein of unknown function (DUF2844)
LAHHKRLNLRHNPGDISMPQFSFLSRAICSAALFSLLAAIPASASLGDNEASVGTDAQHIRASVRVTQKTNYTIHEMDGAAGTKIREYVSPEGKVFGVAWQGPARPDLQQLLGSYYARASQLVQQEKAQRNGRHPISIKASDIVVQMGGHPRDFNGQVYLPSLTPSNVSAQEIR